MTSLPELKSCSIGTSLNEKCKRTIKDLKDISDFDDEKKEIIDAALWFGEYIIHLLLS